MAPFLIPVPLIFLVKTHDGVDIVDTTEILARPSRLLHCFGPWVTGLEAAAIPRAEQEFARWQRLEGIEELFDLCFCSFHQRSDTARP
ncbi:MAG: hypothetical protein Q9218_004696 [Villophora microphyllina]